MSVSSIGKYKGDTLMIIEVLVYILPIILIFSYINIIGRKEFKKSKSQDNEYKEPNDFWGWVKITLTGIVCKIPYYVYSNDITGLSLKVLESLNFLGNLLLGFVLYVLILLCHIKLGQKK